jgi:hypothetical protein
VVADATTTIAGIDERAGDPDAAEKALVGIIDQARRDGDASAEMRGRYLMAGLHHERGDLDAARAAYHSGYQVALQAGLPWAPYGFEARLMEALVSYEAGDWDTCLRLTQVAGQSPPPIPEAMLLGVRAMALVGRGAAEAPDLLDQIRPSWGLDGLVGISAAAAEIDWHGDRGDVAAALASFERSVQVVGVAWSESFQARIRLTALLLGHLGSAAVGATQPERTALVEPVPELMSGVDRVMHRVHRRKRPFGPEGVAWLERTHAEHLRLRWLADEEPPEEDELVAAWERTLAGFEAIS